MSRVNIGSGRAADLIVASGFKLEPTIEALGGAQAALVSDSPPLQVLDPEAASVDVLLPPEERGLCFVIVNAADAAESLVVKEDSDTTTIGTIAQNEVGLFVCDGASWYALIGTNT